MVIYILEPYLNDSHSHWLKGIENHLEAEVKSFTLPAKHWKWRMHASAITFSELLRNQPQPDHILVSDMCSAALLKSLLPSSWRNYKLSVYFHENQITYPWHHRDQDVVNDRNNHYGFINYTSALAADKVFFNSNYHKEVFLNELPSFLDQFPDHKNKSSITGISDKCHVSPIGIERYSMLNSEKWSLNKPTILWNHRWEYDKNPETFFDILFQLSKKGLSFNLAVLGRHGKIYPPVFDLAKENLKEHIIHWGFAESKTDYASILKSSHILPVTSNQDFFGISALEAISAGVFPLLPKRLAFTEHLSDEIPYYSEDEELLEKIEEFLINWKKYAPILHCKADEYSSEVLRKYQWPIICQELLENLNAI